MLASTELAARRRRAPRGSGEQLRQEIVAAAKVLLAKAPSADDVSIRAVADAVGVTSPSIYLHFADKNELLSAVVADVFADLDRAMLSAGEGISDPLEQLRAYGLAYVRFATSHPEHYRIATMDPCPRPDVDVVFADGAFQHFSAVVQQCIESGVFEPGDPLRITLELWSAAHGIASLLIAKPFLPWGDIDEVADRVLCSAAMGHAVLHLLDDHQPHTVSTWLDRVSSGRRRSRPAAG